MKIATPQETGFTLVEIMIVVAIIGLLGAIAVPSIVHARTQSQQNACINNLRQIDDACQQWALEKLKPANATVSFDDIRPYLKSTVICPSGGTSATFADSYTLSTVSNKPVCNVLPATHMLLPDPGESSVP